MRSFLLTVLLACVSAPLAAYASFDEVLEIEPTWTPIPVAQPLSDIALYRVRLLAADRIRLELRNPGHRSLTIAVDLPGYSVEGAPLELTIAAGVESATEVAVRRADRACTERAVRFVRIAADGVALPVRPFVAVPPPSPHAYALSTTWEAAGFRANAVAYSAMPAPDGRIDLRLMNRSAQPIHAEFRLLGWQDPATVVSRLHLLPGVTTDVLVPGIAVDARVMDAALALWAVRVGDDAGPALGEGPADQRGFAPLADGWRPVALGDTDIAGFNPRLLVYRFTAAGVEVGNRADAAVGARLEPLGGAPAAPVDVQLAPRATRVLPLAAGHGPTLLARGLVLDGTHLHAPQLAIASAPVNAMPVQPLHGDDRFNPQTIMATVAPDGADRARVTMVNRAAIDLHCAWSLPAYQQGTPNARLHLPAGTATTVTVPVGAADVRLALAEVAVWEVRLGADTGTAWCVAPAR